MDNKEEQKIIELAKTDPAEFAPVFRKYHAAIFRYAAYRSGNAEAAADITSETFFKALKGIGSYKNTGVPFSAWLYRIASNEASFYFRKKKYEPRSYEEALENGGITEPSSRQDMEQELLQVQEEIERNRDYADIRHALDRLDAKYRDAVILRYLEEKSIAEISQITGRKEGTVKSLISRGVFLLKKTLEKQRNRERP